MVSTAKTTYHFPHGDMNRLAPIQVLRAMAALAVFGFHASKSLVDSYQLTDTNYFSIGSAGVDLFFVISGFVMCYATRRPDTRRFGDFMIKRATRIIPIYWLMTLVLFGVALVAPALLHTTEADLTHLLKSLAFIPYEKTNGYMHPILFLGWTLNYEMFFYVIFGLTLWAGIWRAHLTIALVTSVALAGYFLHPESAELQFYTNTIILEFAFGALIYLAYEHTPRGLRAFRWLWPVFALVLLVQNFHQPDMERVWRWGLPSAMLFAAIIGFTVHTPGSATIVSKRPSLLYRGLAHLGNASYALYLIHPYVMEVCQIASLNMFESRTVAAGVAIITSLVGSIIAAFLLFEWLEKPINNALRATMLRRAASRRMLYPHT